MTIEERNMAYQIKRTDEDRARMKALVLAELKRRADARALAADTEAGGPVIVPQAGIKAPTGDLACAQPGDSQPTPGSWPGPEQSETRRPTDDPQ